MNKDSIYKLIGYNGEYNSKVKKAIRKLLKQYHPDCQGDEDIFKLICEVKKELETNNISFQGQKNKKRNDLDDIDYDYCEEMISNLEIKKNETISKLNALHNAMEKLNMEYRDLYSENLDKKGIVLNKNSIFDEKNFQKKMIFLCLVLIVIFAIYILLNNYVFLVIFVLGIVIIIYYLIYLSTKINKMLIIHKLNFKSYLESSKDIQRVLNTKIRMQNKQNNLEIKLKRIENDLRFYHNILKGK